MSTRMRSSKGASRRTPHFAPARTRPGSRGLAHVRPGTPDSQEWVPAAAPARCSVKTRHLHCNGSPPSRLGRQSTDAPFA